MEPQLHQPCCSKQNAKFDEQYIIRNTCRGNPGFTSVQYSVINWWNTGQKWHRAGVHLSPLRWFRLGTTRGIHWPLRNFFHHRWANFYDCLWCATPSEPTPFRDCVARPMMEQPICQDICREYRLTSEKNSHFLFMFTVGLTASTWSRKQLAQPHRLWGMHCSGPMSWGACLDNQANLRPFSSLLQSPQWFLHHTQTFVPNTMDSAHPSHWRHPWSIWGSLGCIGRDGFVNTSDTASRANGLHERFQKGTTVLGLFLVKEVMMGLEGLKHFTAGER